MANSSKEAVNTTLEKYGVTMPKKDISDFLYLISDNTLGGKSDKDIINGLVRKLFKEGFEIHSPDGTKKIGSKVLQQALWRVMSKIKFLDCPVHGSGKSENEERLVTEGIATVAERGGLGACFRGKAGVFINSVLLGDGYLFFGKGENDENPISFRVLRNEDVYYDSFAYGVRGVRPANKMAVIYQYDKDEAYELWPELETNDVWGRIPGTFMAEDTEEARKSNSDIVEICWGWNRAKKKHIIFAGTQCFEIDSFEGEEYPCIKNNKAYIPIFQFLCIPSLDEFSNNGIGQMLFDLAVITRKLLNLEVTHLDENVLPFTFINAPQAKVDELIEKMAMANKARAQGMTPVVAMEFSQAGQGANAQSLVTQNLFNEWSAVWDRLYREISRLGINLDDIERGAGITRGQVIAEEQASNAFVLQMGEYNGEDTKELMECIMDAITENVSVKNKTPLNLTTQLMMEDGSKVKVETEITMGMLSKTLKEGNWFAIPDVRTGAIPSDLTKMIHEERLLAMIPPGTPEYSQLFRQIAMRMGSDMKLGAGNGAVPPPPGQMTQDQGAGAPVPPQIPAGTQRVLPGMTGSLNTPV